MDQTITISPEQKEKIYSGRPLAVESEEVEPSYLPSLAMELIGFIGLAVIMSAGVVLIERIVSIGG